MEQQGKTPLEYIEILYRRKWFLIVPAILGTIIGGFIAYTLPSYYRSTTLILVEEQKVPQKYVMPADMTPIEQRLSTLRQQVMSRTKLEQIIEDFGLYQDGESSNSLINFLNNIELFKRLGLFQKIKATKEEIIERMREDIEVEVIGRRRGGGDAFSISYIGKDPFITMQVTNALASLFIEENLKIREQYAEGTSEFLAGELERARKELEKQETALRRFKETHLGSLPEQLDANLRTLDRLQLELQSVQDAIRNAEERKLFLEEQIRMERQAILSTTAVTPAPVVVTDPLVEELERLKGELTHLLSIYKENYPDVVITRNRIKEIEKELANRKKIPEGEEESSDSEPDARHSNFYADLMAVKSRIENLKRREKEIREQIKVYEKRVEDTPANEQKLTALKRDYDISLQNYKNLLEKKLNAELAESMEKRQKGRKFRVLDPANFPEKPYKPNRVMITLLGTIGGGGLGMGLIFLLDFLNPAFRKSEDFNGVIVYPVLSTIPDFSKGALKKRQRGGLKVIKGRKV